VLILIAYAGVVKTIQMFRWKFVATRSTGTIQETSKMTLRSVHVKLENFVSKCQCSHWRQPALIYFGIQLGGIPIFDWNSIEFYLIDSNFLFIFQAATILLTVEQPFYNKNEILKYLEQNGMSHISHVNVTVWW